MGLITKCRVCDSSKLQMAIDLGDQPWGNHFLKPDEVGREPKYPLQVVWCQDCHAAQLNFTVPKEVMFGDHTYLSGVTKTLSAHFMQEAVLMDACFPKSTDKCVLDIGSNDGTQLKQYKALGWSVLGVESSKTTALIANVAGIPTVNEFFNLEVGRKMGKKFDVINAAGVFYHLEELHSITDAIRESLKADGIFSVQFMYMKHVLENLTFDQIYHEHLLYYNLATLQRLLERHGLEIFDSHFSQSHGGSVVAYACHKGARPPSAKFKAMLADEERTGCNTLEAYKELAKKIEEVKANNLAFLKKAKAAGKRIYGMGAPVKGNTLLNYFGIGTQYLDVLVEKNRLRKGLISPGMHIPVVIEDELTVTPDVYYVLAWNFKKEILANNAELIRKGVEFYFPLDPKDLA